MPQKLLINTRGRTISVPMDKAPKYLDKGFINAPEDALLGQYYPEHDNENISPPKTGVSNPPPVPQKTEIDPVQSVMPPKKEPNKQKMFKHRKTHPKSTKV